MGAVLLLWGLLALLTPAACGQCYSPPMLNTAILKNNSKSVFDIGDTLIYECFPGYVKRKFSTICLENSTWSSVNDNMCKRKTCPTPTDLLHGRVQITGPNQFGSTITYSCDEGYQLIGLSSNQCILSGNTVIWENEPPLCETIRCDLPPTIPNGRYRSTNEYFYYGMVVSYECNTGSRGEKLYDLVGNKTLHCTSKDNKVGIWNSPPPRCITLAKCKTPVIANGRSMSLFRPFYLLNDAVELECDPGFTMKGSRVVQCQINSQWDPALPVCFRGCLPPMEISHGKRSKIKDYFSFGDTVYYDCEPGYFLKGSASIKCIEPGKWNYETPKCEVKSCGKFLDQLLNGEVKSPSPPQLGTKVVFVCKEGFWLNGTSSSTCVLRGLTVGWSNKVPVCERITCGFPPPIINGRFPLLSGNKFPYGTVIKYTCFKAFRAIGTQIAHCTTKDQVNGVWSIPAPQCEIYNKTTICLAPQVQERHLKLKFQPLYKHGDTLILACDTNFTMKGHSTLWCQANGTWGPSPMPTCERDCSSPPMILNGRHRNGHSGPVVPGSSVTYSCEPGYLLVGEKTIRCLSSGVWNTAAPTCKGAVCEPLIKFPNGQVKEPSHLQIGATMTFSCNKGYHLQGQASSHCVLATEGAIWTKIPICIEVICPTPPKIENGKYMGSPADEVPYGTQIIYSCNADPEKGVKFSLIGESTIHCMSDPEGNGIWSADPPRCELSASSVQCLHPTVSNGYKISGQGPPYFYNDTVAFRCYTGFTLKGSSQIRCSSNGTWDPEAPICERECLPPPQIPHGQHTGGERSHFAPGMSVDYTCDPGYLLMGNKSICCMSSGAWSLSAPHCEEAACEPIGEQLQLPLDDNPVVLVNSSCQEGYQLTGHVYKLCWHPEVGTRFWFQKIPLCKEVNCSLPEFIIGAQNMSTKKIYHFGAIFTLKCDEGYMLEGSPQSQCQEDHRWDPPLAVCKSVNFSSLQSSQGPVVLSGILLGSILLIIFVGATLAIISKHKEGNYYTNENHKGVAIPVETQETSINDAYSLAT
ncbi:complement receptor type 1-like [Gracilinanus agilis]|uniref:complement receptor type 1-like n=1 Tax=Gracilinanus agilis TaxID=191870 RepID=UPI001CFD8569|nr:complement receptor type 1-like [Gracilinanus agilis]